MLRSKWLTAVMLFLILLMVVTGCIPDHQELDNEGSLSVHIIDVGQGDAILVKTSEKTMLIDGGDRVDSNLVMDYLRSQGVAKLDVVIGTHPHADHIGGLVDIIKDFPVDKIYMPRVSHNTRTFEDLLLNIKEAGLKVTPAKSGLLLDLGSDIEAVFLSPADTSYQSLNNYSAVLKITFGDTSFLFTGDAETEVEKELLSSKYDLSSTVLKVGHHGSSTSSSREFLQAVSPAIAVISVGADNSYGHPHTEVVKRLGQIDTHVLRTDTHGDIILSSDGQEVKVISANH